MQSEWKISLATAELQKQFFWLTKSLLSSLIAKTPFVMPKLNLKKLRTNVAYGH